jgi:hypothetical protein
VCQLIEERAVFGPGSLKGQQARLDPEKRAAIYRAYEVYPYGHPFAGQRRFGRVGLSWRKGTAKTELAAWVCYAELHPEGPVRCDGFRRVGRRWEPVGRPVADPYIPMVAYTEEQVEELAYGALYVVVTEGPDADLFDSGLDRIIRLDQRGRADGKAVPLAGSPNARDGARTTFQHFDEPHRMHLPKLLQAHETMLGNLPKRPMEQPWSLETTTAGEPGQGSIAEKTHAEAEAIHRGEIADPQLFYFHREAGPGHDLSTLDGRIAAISEATGPVGEYAPGQFRQIAQQWDRPGSDRQYLERVWLNRWVRSEAQAFDIKRWDALARPGAVIAPGSFVVAGFDGARFRDATALVVTEISTGLQILWAIWERPADVEFWEVPEHEVTAAVEDLMTQMIVWKLYADPPHWTETVGAWSAKWPDQVAEWWTNRPKPMAYALREFAEAIAAGTTSNTGDPVYRRHIAAAGRHDLTIRDDQGKPLWVLRKQREDRKFDAAMAGVLSNKARLDALKENAQPPARLYVPKRIR